MYLIDFFLKGGFIMWPILALSVVSLSIIMEKFYNFHKIKLNIPQFLSKIEDYLKKGKMEEALNICRKSTSPLAKICTLTLENHKLSQKEKEEIFFWFNSMEVRKLGKNVRTLGIIGHILPLLGLFGTVVGMIKVFIGVENSAGVVNPGTLAGGIWEALLTTAAALAVAIPTLIVYHYLEGKLEDISMQMQDIFFQVEQFLRKSKK